MSQPAKPSRNLSITEGKNDKFVFHHLLAHYHVPEGIIDFKEYEGISNLLAALPPQLEVSGLERLGIVVDADMNLAARWDSLKRILTKAGYQNIPAQPLTEGTILLHADLPMVGVWLMPNNQLPGILEDFVSFLVPPNDALWNRAEQCISRIPDAERRFTSTPKAQIHTWLA